MKANSAYEAWVTPHLADLAKYCRYLAGTRWDAEDLLQDTLLKAFVYYVQAEPCGEMKPFIFRIAKNLWIDACRKRSRRRALREWTREVYEDNDYADVRGSIEWLAERLPGRNIEIWLLFHYFGYSMQEIAQATGCTVSAVKSVLHRTREMLRNRDALSGRRKAAGLDVERWSRAIMQDRPQSVLHER